jgi:glycosyltransferase involved in cell wall biosynthesis
MKPLVSVIVTTKNNEHTLSRCLFSIKQQTYKNIELIVVDNFSRDRTFEIAREFTSKVYQCGPERSSQRNLGAKKTKGTYLLFIDSDMELKPDVVSACVGYIKNLVGLVIPERFVGEGFWTNCKILEKSCYTGGEEHVAARFFAKKTFVKVGGYDEHLTGPEDIDLHKRVLALGKIGTASAWITHHEGRLTLRGIVKKRYYYSLTLKRYLAKHPRTGEFSFFRSAFLRQWKKLLSDPVHAVGMLVMRFCEGLAVLIALLKS